MIQHRSPGCWPIACTHQQRPHNYAAQIPCSAAKALPSSMYICIGKEAEYTAVDLLQEILQKSPPSMGTAAAHMSTMGRRELRRSNLGC